MLKHSVQIELFLILWVTKLIYTLIPQHFDLTLFISS